MKKVGITGQQGFVGKHLYNFLSLQEDVELIEYEKKFFKSAKALQNFVKKCDVIVHLAAMNRHEDPQVIYDTNIDLTKKLIAACEAKNVQPHILISSSTQEEKDNEYGKSKKESRELLEKWGAQHSAKVTGMVIPNVFGPFGKPFYNSVVATFCYQVVNGQRPTIINDGVVKLIYVNELIEEIYGFIKQEKEGRIQISHRHEIKVSELLEKLKLFSQEYLWNGEFPNINSPLDLALFNTYRCYIPHDYYPRPYVKHTDNRGSFVEVVRANTAGQFSFSTTKPGITRGNHFHTRKAERFAVIQGKAKIQLRKVDTDEVVEYEINGKNPSYVDMPIWHIHNISNIGEEELIALFWINEPYNEKDPDTYYATI